MAANTILKGKAALVTGSTQGIGLAMLKALASAGCNVTMHGIPNDMEKIQRLCKQIAKDNSVEVTYSDANLLNPGQIRDMVRESHSAFGRLDILVNNAGIQHVAPVHELPDDKWDAIIGVCLSATFHATKAALPYMLEQGWGRIINTGSMHALVASPFKSAYNAAKHGVAGFTKTVALEVATKNVTVNAICPGYTDTDLVRNQIADTARIRGIPVESVIRDVLLADQPSKKFVKPEDIGALVVHLCGPHSDSFTGACLSIDGGWVAR
ncbi:hypothetical protein VOLCADRAFT_106906 [Volvox carteri f. nagariensis]|uniref:3-oxoacyl-[acyl-carrier-protein] reductase n=1 Tax=Volvox carteri f. nagariensis TaxID=3068 RepID=D8UAH9_VOLCA|nr:uncharacterized protein VOLCADRAFT_106906 [Volvox carteri f. nagariensis]EFJ43262.1 hypothetical protein VOLCADRAFT_106906 [Volvox carteri f. nagariensis]|eukprot:XP_002955622.1 hypothetical protein VOLCADRAFT_106906 [Volvox carteri f. nagariensis]